MKQEEIKVSIIIPIYKVEKYLRKCLDSVVAQTYQNIEVFLVDDGSPDNCGKICEEYAAKNSIFNVIHQKNQGQAAARNNAVKVSNGDFILFIDSDDWVEPDCVEYLVTLQKRYKADIAIGGFKYLYEGKKINARSNKEKIITMNTEESLIQMNYGNGYGATPWAKLCRRELIEAHPFPVGQIYEDLATMYKIFGDARSIVYGSRRVYYWLQRKGSTMHSEFDERQMVGLEAASAQLKYVEERYPNVIQAAKVRYMGKVVELMSIAFKSNNNEVVYKTLKKKMLYYDEVIADTNIKKSLIFRLQAMKLGYSQAKFIFFVHEKLKEMLL